MVTLPTQLTLSSGQTPFFATSGAFNAVQAASAIDGVHTMLIEEASIEKGERHVFNPASVAESGVVESVRVEHRNYGEKGTLLRCATSLYAPGDSSRQEIALSEYTVASRTSGFGHPIMTSRQILQRPAGAQFDRSTFPEWAQDSYKPLDAEAEILELLQSAIAIIKTHPLITSGEKRLNLRFYDDEWNELANPIFLPKLSENNELGIALYFPVPGNPNSYAIHYFALTENGIFPKTNRQDLGLPNDQILELKLPSSNEAGIRVYKSIAISIGDPFGKKKNHIALKVRHQKADQRHLQIYAGKDNWQDAFVGGAVMTRSESIGEGQSYSAAMSDWYTAARSFAVANDP